MKESAVIVIMRWSNILEVVSNSLLVYDTYIDTRRAFVKDMKTQIAITELNDIVIIC